MPKLGTWTTIDCPTDNQVEALSFLQVKFGKIGGIVREVINLHEITDYPSFEIDSPDYVEDYDENAATDEESIKYNSWVDEADEIESEYNKKFEEWL